MAKPTWSKGLSFALSVQKGMPPRILATWEESILFLDQLIREHKLDLYHVYIHWHEDPELTHYCGVTYIDDKRMAFCSGNDKETMLHEIAHLEYKETEHNEIWAGKLIDLHEKYLTGKALEKANADLSKDYKAAERVFKRRQRKVKVAREG
jgi:hypothetical protein